MPPTMASGMPTNTSRAEELKLLANEAFKAHKYSQAIDLYTQAIEANNDNAVYWANRAFAHTKLEEYGSAILDSTKAIEIDPKYSKGYYRRGAAYLGLGKFKEALKDFQQVKKLCPNDPDAAKKLKECEKAVMKLKFEEAIAVPQSEKVSIADSIDYHAIGTSPGSCFVSLKVIAVPAAVALVAVLAVYVGTKAALVVAATAMATILVFWGTFWKGRCKDSIFTKTRTLDLDVEPQYAGARIEGDVVTLDFVKKMMDDFKNQKCLHKRYAYQIVLQTREMLRALPSLVDINVPNGKHFTVCGDVHGQFYDLLNIFELNGLPSEDNPYLFNGDFVDRGSFSVEVILTLFAFKCMSPSGLMCELLWSDPQPQLGRGPSKRGVGLSFGADVTKRFLQDNSLDLVVRSHEVKNDGYEIEHDGKLITVFSAPNYCDQMGNKGAFIQFEAPELKPNIVTFSAVPHPDVKPMAYANNFLRMFS
ncbi:serine/threonine-protein phosphatase 5-like isoform X3 [Olea europaea var. sylvestris]|uniref:serine/threonine-protein phosphatase 5-like isoform X3 n=1 Tax=Olea europaea var. sylvestris TaxID=158386 RepID=UPI000C1D8B82|nr:serine/threonine-protein phosphatase 5-like isoform X3 [Olea europaea var. sylvestris]